MTLRTALAATALLAMSGLASAQQPSAAPPPPPPPAAAQTMPGDAASRMPHAPDVPLPAMAPRQPAYDPNHGPGPDKLPDGKVPSRPDELQAMTRRMQGSEQLHVRLSKGDASVDLGCGDLGPQACLEAAARTIRELSAPR